MYLFIQRFSVILAICVLSGCATLEDLQNSSRLIRMDNEIAKLLAEKKPSDLASDAPVLVTMGNEAKKAAQEIIAKPKGRKADAISYCRIAATAYWKSNRTEVVNDLFAVAQQGTDLCNQMENNAPDRDCLFLQLAIPFAGLESNAKSKGLAAKLKSLNFTSGKASQEDIDTMAEINLSIRQIKVMVEEILSLGENNPLLAHQGMQEYYCNNAKKAAKHYSGIVQVFIAKVKDFDNNSQNDDLELGITVDDARELKLKNESPKNLCSKEES